RVRRRVRRAFCMILMGVNSLGFGRDAIARPLIRRQRSAKKLLLRAHLTARDGSSSLDQSRPCARLCNECNCLVIATIFCLFQASRIDTPLGKAQTYLRFDWIASPGVGCDAGVWLGISAIRLRRTSFLPALLHQST